MKVERNRQRDEKVTRLCQEKGWTVVRFWEHEVVSDPGKVIVKLLSLFSKIDRKASRQVSRPTKKAS